MPESMKPGKVSADYIHLKGSNRRASCSARVIGPVNAEERISITVVLRRKIDAEPLPDFEYFSKTPPRDRPVLSRTEFANKYGASDDDMNAVGNFLRAAGLDIEQTNAVRRIIEASGTAHQLSNAFGVTLKEYEHRVLRRRGTEPATESYRGREGFIHIPRHLEGIIVGVFGLDNRRISKRASADPSNTTAVTVRQVTQLYDFPSNAAAGQTIGIFSEAGYQLSDISVAFDGSPPGMIDVNVGARNNGAADHETTQDICIAAAAAPGAAIAVYFTTYDEKGWIDLINRWVHPGAGDPRCSVLSASFYVSRGDDPAQLTHDGVSISWINAVHMALQDAATVHGEGRTFCTVSGDYGVDGTCQLCCTSDLRQHVSYPGSDPWALCCGGTTLGNISGSSFDEYVWNDIITTSGGAQIPVATGGGVSDLFPLPSYQRGAGIPRSLKDNHVGRGVPDVAANASPSSGYQITVGGVPRNGNGTSAAAPLWAGLIAVINAGLGHNVGFINPVLYQIGSTGFRDIVGPPGPADNGINGIPGYPARPGWDACTGWGSPHGQALLDLATAQFARTPAQTA